MGKTSIEWADHSINPFRARNLETGKVGHFCIKISCGCKFCYASRMQKPHLTQLEYVAENRPKVELFLEEKALQEVLHRRKPTRYFWCDMTDMFLDDYPDEWIDRCFAVMALTPQHTHLVLTKRAERMCGFLRKDGANQDRIGAAARDLSKSVTPFRLPSEEVFDARSIALGEPWKTHSWPLPNVWLGVSVEDQQRADERIPLLLRTPVAVRFLSVEPLLGPVDLTRINHTAYLRAALVRAVRWSAERNGEDVEAAGKMAAQSVTDEVPEHERPNLNALTGAWFDGWDGGEGESKLDWVIVGGESGPGARPFDTDWARTIVQQCKDSGTACFVKQLGAHVIQDSERRIKRDRKGGDMSEWPHDIRVRELPEAR